jgi:drug/metabolite transporter (DMT)-like permease
MLSILITILLFSCLIILFKFFDRYKVDNLQALIINYITAGTLSLFFFDTHFSISTILKADWLLHSIVIGVLFIITFNFYAFGTQKVGITVATIANKMALVITVAVSMWLYKDDAISIYKIIGVVLGIMGIYFASTKGGKLSFNKSYLWIIIVIFIGQGIADSFFTDARKLYVSDGEVSLFFVVLFFFAALTGLIILTGKSLSSPAPIEAKNILWGIALGVPNFGCLYYMSDAIKNSQLQPSEVFPLVSMGVIVLSSLIGLAFYKEKLTKGNWMGIGFAVLAIAVISFGNRIQW